MAEAYRSRSILRFQERACRAWIFQAVTDFLIDDRIAIGAKKARSR